MVTHRHGHLGQLARVDVAVVCVEELAGAAVDDALQLHCVPGAGLAGRMDIFNSLHP